MQNLAILFLASVLGASASAGVRHVNRPGWEGHAIVVQGTTLVYGAAEPTPAWHARTMETRMGWVTFYSRESDQDATAFALGAMGIDPRGWEPGSEAVTQGGAGSSPGSADAVGNTVVVNAPGQGTQNGIVCTNGNYAGDYPDYAGSTGTARLRKKPNGGSARSEVTTSGNFEGLVTGIQAGDTVTAGAGDLVFVSGTGGDVNVGSNSHVTVYNSGVAGGPNITAHLPGGSTVTVMPGMTVPLVG